MILGMAIAVPFSVCANFKVGTVVIDDPPSDSSPDGWETSLLDL